MLRRVRIPEPVTSTLTRPVRSIRDGIRSDAAAKLSAALLTRHRWEAEAGLQVPCSEPSGRAGADSSREATAKPRKTEKSRGSRLPSAATGGSICRCHICTTGMTPDRAVRLPTLGTPNIGTNGVHRRTQRATTPQGPETGVCGLVSPHCPRTRNHEASLDLRLMRGAFPQGPWGLDTGVARQAGNG